jgi:hypothetical protein
MYSIWSKLDPKVEISLFCGILEIDSVVDSKIFVLDADPTFRSVLDPVLGQYG